MKCPCCEQELRGRRDLLFSDDRRAVLKDGKCVLLSPMQYKLISALRRRTLTNSELIEVLYSDRPDGGPMTASNVIHVTINAMNRKLADLGIKVGADRHGPHTPLKIKMLSP